MRILDKYPASKMSKRNVAVHTIEERLAAQVYELQHELDCQRGAACEYIIVNLSKNGDPVLGFDESDAGTLVEMGYQRKQLKRQLEKKLTAIIEADELCEKHGMEPDMRTLIKKRTILETAIKKDPTRKKELEILNTFIEAYTAALKSAEE